MSDINFGIYSVILAHNLTVACPKSLELTFQKKNKGRRKNICLLTIIIECVIFHYLLHDNNADCWYENFY